MIILHTGRITGRPKGKEGNHTTVFFGKKKKEEVTFPSEIHTDSYQYDRFI